MKFAPEATTERNETRKLRTSEFSCRLLDEWRRLELPRAGVRVVVATSGGADSMALLRGVLESVETDRLSVEVIIAHLDHGLRGEQGRQDARWVAAQAAALRCEAEIGFADVRGRASAAGDNLEQAARGARYEFLRAAAEKHHARYVLTGHTMNDQAETMLMRLMRGGGTEGLGAIRPLRTLETSSPESSTDVQLARPLLGWAQSADTENYCCAQGVEFRHDAMNEDEAFARVRVRRKLIPLMESFNPRIIETLARTAGILREDADALREEATKLIDLACDAREGKKEESQLRVAPLAGASRSLRRNALRQWLRRERGDLRRLESAHISAIERLLNDGRGGRVVELPGGGRVERRKGNLRFFREES